VKDFKGKGEISLMMVDGPFVKKLTENRHLVLGGANNRMK